MNFIDKFEEASYKERLAFTLLCQNFNLFQNNNYIVTPTPTTSMEHYDYSIHKFENNRLVKRIIIEVKIRALKGKQLDDARRDGYILESRKYNSMMKFLELDPNASILYMSFTNDGVYIFDLNQLTKDKMLKGTKMEMNKQTVISKSDKITKTVFLLKPEWAVKHYPFIWDERMFREDIAKKDLEAQKKKDIVKDDIMCIWKYLMA